ncbi:MAG: MFS transporter [Trueperaceae bacterium]|nr:MFS transporter [Trueperaceae bacterium]
MPPAAIAALNPRAILRASYTAMFVQAMVVNLTPLLFVTLSRQFDLSFEQVGRLVLVNFATQMLTDVVSAGVVDRVSAKLLAVLANAFAAVGLWVFALAPFRLGDPYLGLLLGTVVFSVGCGLLEVIISPIVERTPPVAVGGRERKAAGMALLHAFYPIGKVAVTVVTGLAFLLVGVERWPTLMLAWSVVPALNTLAFVGLRLPPMFEVGTRTRVRDLLRRRASWWALVAILLAGATEVSLAQWASAFVERGLGTTKLTADLLGLGAFGVGMIVGRLWFGFRGEEADLVPLLRRGALAAAGAALAMAFAPGVWVSLAATAFAGLAVSLLWPGVVSLTASRFPLAGASLFALLAVGGDAGAGVMPWLVGVAADQVRWAPAWLVGAATPEQVGLRVGVALAAVPAVAMAVVVGRLRRG